MYTTVPVNTLIFIQKNTNQYTMQSLWHALQKEPEIRKRVWLNESMKERKDQTFNKSNPYYNGPSTYIETPGDINDIMAIIAFNNIMPFDPMTSKSPDIRDFCNIFDILFKIFSLGCDGYDTGFDPKHYSQFSDRYPDLFKSMQVWAFG